MAARRGRKWPGIFCFGLLNSAVNGGLMLNRLLIQPFVAFHVAASYNRPHIRDGHPAGQICIEGALP
jgi:hypothetical protein